MDTRTFLLSFSYSLVLYDYNQCFHYNLTVSYVLCNVHVGLFNGYASRPRDFNYADLLEMLFPGDLSLDVFLLFARMHLNSVLQVPL